MMRYRKGDNERSSLFTRRALLLGGAQAALTSALVGRLYQLQVLETNRFSTLAEENRVSMRLLPPPRGLIFDRTGLPLAVNRNNFRAVATSDRGRGAELLLDLHAPETHLPLVAAATRAGLSPARSGRGTTLRIAGLRRTRRLAELLGPRPPTVEPDEWPGHGADSAC